MAIDFKVKGLDHAISIPDQAKGKMLKQQWVDFKQGKRADALVNVSNKWTGMLSDIRSFMEAEGVNFAESEKKIEEKNLAFENEVRNFLSLKPSEKAKIALAYFRIVYWGFTQKLSEEVMIGDKPIEDYALAINLDFYKNNPTAYRPPTTIYRSIIKSEVCNSMAMGFLTGVIRSERDIEWIRRKGGGPKSVAEIMK